MGKFCLTKEELINELNQLKKRNEDLEQKLKEKQLIHCNNNQSNTFNESEILYKTLFENTEDGFEIIEPIYDEDNKIYDYRWVEVNKAWEKQVGLNTVGLVGKRATDVFSDDGSYWIEKYSSVVKNGKSERYEVYGEETRRWFECLCFPYVKGKLCILFRDITKKKQAELALKESEKLYRMLFENTEDAFHIAELIYDEDKKPFDYKIVKLNEPWEKQTGLNPFDVIGKRVTQVMPSIEPYWLEMYNKIMKFNKSMRYENYNEGTKRWYSMVGFPYAKDQIGVLFRDITTSKTNQDKLQQSEKNSKELVEKLRKVDENMIEFLNMFSHEIRNPMSAAMLSLSLINSVKPYSVQVIKAEDTLNRQLKHLSGLIDDLLDVTRIKTNKVKLNKEVLEVNELIQNAVIDHMALYEQKKVTLEFESSSNPLYIDADNIRINQVLDNLLSNAVKFTKDGDSTTLKVERDERKSEVVITIRDTGEGIAPENQAELFNPFMQVDNSLDRRNGGLGLGLAIVKGIVEVHGGSVKVFSEGIGKGTYFTIRLPLYDNIVEKKDNFSSEEKKSTKALNVIVIDDNKDLTEIMCDLIGFLGHKAVSALSGMDGILKAKEIYPDVIISDIGLPVMDGYEVAMNIRNDNDLKDVYLIALSGYAQHEDVERSRKAGFNRHLAKPITLDTLKATFEEIANDVSTI